jgi:hypothetical protein
VIGEAPHASVQRQIRASPASITKLDPARPAQRRKTLISSGSIWTSPIECSVLGSKYRVGSILITLSLKRNVLHSNRSISILRKPYAQGQ